ncbi:MAG: hypothetical protein ABIW32_09320 [Terrimesophilobacter sp.]
MIDEPRGTELGAGEERETVTIRRAPKFSVFIVVGALIGFLVTLVLTSLFETDPEVGFAASLGYFSLYGISIGGVIGALIALAFDRRSSRRATEVIAGKLAVRVEDDSSPDSANDSTPNNTPDSDG